MDSFRRLALAVILAGMLSTCSTCSSFNQPHSPQAARSEIRAGANEVAGQQNFSLRNFTGASLHGLYVSPTSVSGWEENVLGEDELKDGDTIDVWFDPNDNTGSWDVMIEGVGHYAEWKNLKLGDGAEITLLVKPGTVPTVVAEVERY